MRGDWGIRDTTAVRGFDGVEKDAGGGGTDPRGSWGADSGNGNALVAVATAAVGRAAIFRKESPSFRRDFIH